MEWHKPIGQNGDASAGDHAPPADGLEAQEGHDNTLATAATVAVVGAGVLIFEAALLPGLVLGIATMLVPKQLPRLGAMVTPLVRSTVRGAYMVGQKTKEMFAEVHEQVHDIVAEVDAEGNKKSYPAKAAPGE